MSDLPRLGQNSESVCAKNARDACQRWLLGFLAVAALVCCNLQETRASPNEFFEVHLIRSDGSFDDLTNRWWMFQVEPPPPLIVERGEIIKVKTCLVWGSIEGWDCPLCFCGGRSWTSTSVRFNDGRGGRCVDTPYKDGDYICGEPGPFTDILNCVEFEISAPPMCGTFDMEIKAYQEEGCHDETGFIAVDERVSDDLQGIGGFRFPVQVCSCGNGVLEGPGETFPGAPFGVGKEECDDGNDIAGDGCSNCRFDCVSDPDCDDGYYCNGPEICLPSHVCAKGPWTDCPDDGDPCTVDMCFEPCAYFPGVPCCVNIFNPDWCGACCRPGGCSEVSSSVSCVDGTFYAGEQCEHVGLCGSGTPGACCTSSGECTNVASAEGCSGTYHSGVSCSPAVCGGPAGWGACCTPTGCTVTASAGACSGTFVEGTSCSPNPCETGPSGACCRLSGCTDVASAGECTGGTFLSGASCTTFGVCKWASELVGTGGGTLETPDGAVTLTFPSGCLTASTTIDVQQGSFPARLFDLDLGSGVGAGFTVHMSYDFSPDTLTFCPEAQLCVSFDRMTLGISAAQCASLGFLQKDQICKTSTGAGSHAQCTPTVPCTLSGETCQFDWTNPTTTCTCPDSSSIGTCCTNISHFSEYGLVTQDQAIPTVSEWGLLVLTLLLLVCAKVYFSRREAEAMKPGTAN